MSILRGLFGLKKSRNYDFTDEDRAIAAARKRSRALLADKMDALNMLRLEVEMADLRNQLKEYSDEYEGIDADKLLIGLLGGKIPEFLDALRKPPLPQQETAAERTLSDDEIRALLAKFDKKQQKMAAKLPDDVLMIHARRLFPGYDADTYERAIRILKEDS